MNALATWGDAFAGIIAGGTNLLMPYAHALAYGFLSMAIMLFAGSMAFSSGGPVMGAARLAVASGFWIIVIENAQNIGEGLLSGAVQFGLLAGGHSINEATLTQSPDGIFAIGYGRAIELFHQAADVCAANTSWASPAGCLSSMDVWLPLSVGGWSIFIAFAVLAISVMLTFILFKVFVLLAIILLPLAMFEHTSWLGMGPIRAIAHSVVQVFVLSMAASVGSVVFAKLNVGFVPGLSSSMPFILASFTLMAMTIGAQKMSYSLTHGAMMGAGSLFGAPAGMSVAGARSGSGHLDAPVTAAGRAAIGGVAAAGGTIYQAISAAASANASNMGTMTTRPVARINPNKKA